MGKPYGRSYVLITGATTGIGYELAKLYANDGNNLILVARDEEKLEKVKEELMLLYNINVYSISLDLSEDNSCEKLLNYVNKKNISVDILINNAGLGSFGYLSEIEIEKELNLKKAAKSVGEKSIEMIKSKELLPFTGYIHGGCSPIGIKKSLVTTIDISVEKLETFIFSAGKIGYQVELSLDELKKVISFQLADVV